MWLRIVIAATLAVAIGLAAADAPKNITRGELALVPEYCPDTQTFSPRGSPDGPTESQARWVAQMGRAFWAMHHYCWALISANRAKQGGVSPQERRYLYQSAINDSIFVLENSQPGFVLLPEIYFRMGQFYVALGDLARAQEVLQKSLELKADYWPASVELASINVALGRRQAAAEILEAGLQNSPGQTQLAAALQRLKAPAAAPPRRAASAAKR